MTLRCELPAKWGQYKGQSVRGTLTGYDRHYRAGEAPCEECREADSTRRKASYWANLERERATRKANYLATQETVKERAANWYYITKDRRPLWVTWRSIKQRCLDPNAQHYQYYGGRGITLYEPWLDPNTFIKDVEAAIGSRPPNPVEWRSKKPYYSLDRIDNDGHYEPGNLRWATPKEQAANRRSASR